PPSPATARGSEGGRLPDRGLRPPPGPAPTTEGIVTDRGLMDLCRRFGRRLRELRKRSGVTQRALAERARLLPAVLSPYEAGVAAATWPAVVRLAGALGVTPDAFLALDAAEPRARPG